MAQDLGGVMVWHIGSDDINGECGEKQGLLKIANHEIENYLASINLILLIANALVHCNK